MGKRHQSRIDALKILYGEDIKQELHLLTPEIFEEISSNWDGELSDFTKELVLGIAKNYNNIDKLITETSKHWKIQRMSVIDRNILRIGLFELMNKEPVAIVINEAILLAKSFGSEHSTAFINGILDNVKGKL